MRARSLVLPLLLACLASPLAARADDPIPQEFRRLKKGLWETTINGADPGQAMMAMAMKRLESLPPEKRARAEAMLKQQLEARGGGPAAAPRTHQFCVTQEKLDRKEGSTDFAGQAMADCSKELLSRTATGVTYRASCTRNGRSSVIEFHFEAKSREEVSGSTTVEAEANGQPFRTTVDFASRWVGASCGEVK